MPLSAVGDGRLYFYAFGEGELGLAERFGDEEAFLLEFVGKIHNLPRGGGEEARVARFDAMGRASVELGDDALEVVRFFGGDLIVRNGFTWESVPQKNDLAKVRAFLVGNLANALASGDELFNCQFHYSILYTIKKLVATTGFEPVTLGL